MIDDYGAEIEVLFHDGIIFQLFSLHRDLEGN